jgi:serine/threonine-protein kinase HipA
MTEVLHVALRFSPTELVRVGRVALDRNAAAFEYDPAFAASGSSLNPLFGRVAPGVLNPRNPRAFRGLHGVFADSLPDAWGQLLIDRQLRRNGVRIETLTTLDYLALMGDRGRGALVYEPLAAREADDAAIDLAVLAREATELLEGADSDVLAELERLGGSSGGARPKVQVALDDAGRARSGEHDLPSGFTHWIVKFCASADPPDIGPLEAAYAEAARRSGVEMPRTRLVVAGSGPGYFATERFDRGPNGVRLHMLSIAGMLDADWTMPAIDYEGLLNAVRAATRDEQAVLQMFRRMVFNVAAVNRDDHMKQHALLAGRDGRWRLSPAFDLTLAYGRGGEHYLAVNGRGRDIGREDLLAVAAGPAISRRRAAEVIEDVAAAVAGLPAIAAHFGVSRQTRGDVERAVAEQLRGMR